MGIEDRFKPSSLASFPFPVGAHSLTSSPFLFDHVPATPPLLKTALGGLLVTPLTQRQKDENDPLKVLPPTRRLRQLPPFKWAPRPAIDYSGASAFCAGVPALRAPAGPGLSERPLVGAPSAGPWSWPPTVQSAPLEDPLGFFLAPLYDLLLRNPLDSELPQVPQVVGLNRILKLEGRPRRVTNFAVTPQRATGYREQRPGP